MGSKHPTSVEDAARGGYLNLCSSLHTTPANLLSFLLSIQEEFVEGGVERLWTCGLCGRSSIHTRGERLKKMREGRGVSQKKIAEEIGVSVPHISDVELEKRCATTRIEEGYERICNVNNDPS